MLGSLAVGIVNLNTPLPSFSQHVQENEHVRSIASCSVSLGYPDTQHLLLNNAEGMSHPGSVHM